MAPLSQSARRSTSPPPAAHTCIEPGSSGTFGVLPTDPRQPGAVRRYRACATTSLPGSRAGAARRDEPDEGSLRRPRRGPPLRLTNLERCTGPRFGFTKGQIYRVHSPIAPVRCRTAARPLTLKRCPRRRRPDVLRDRLPEHPSRRGCTPLRLGAAATTATVLRLVDDLPTWSGVAQLGNIELAPSRRWPPSCRSPWRWSCDLYPDRRPRSWSAARSRVWLRDWFLELDLAGVPKTSVNRPAGCRPVSTPFDYDPHEERLAGSPRSWTRSSTGRWVSLHERPPGGRVLKNNNFKKILLWSQNDRTRPPINAYSLRAL